MRVVCVIPARLASSRFPRKILAPLAGKPLLQWSWEAACASSLFDDVLIAIDAHETERVVCTFGGASVMTSEMCASGTDRLIEVIHRSDVAADVWVNWQADEPFISGSMLEMLLSTCSVDQITDVWTLKKRIMDEHVVSSPNVVKVVCDVDDYAMYFSRSPIPFYRSDTIGQKIYYKHIGLYAYTTDALQKISRLDVSELERAERVEQLRFLQHGLRIKVHETDQEVVGIDTPEDLAHAERYVLASP